MNLETDIELIKNVVNCVKELTEEVELVFTKDTMEIQSMDFSHICMINMCLYTEGFEKYDLEKEFSIGLKLSLFNSLLKISKKNDKLQLIHDSKKNDVLKVHINKSKFNLKLITLVQEKYTQQNIPYLFVYKVKSAELERILKDIGGIAEECRMVVKNDIFSFEIKGEMGDGSIEIENENIMKENEEIDLKLNLKYLIIFSKCSKITEYVNIKIAEGIVCFAYDKDEVNLEFYLAAMSE